MLQEAEGRCLSAARNVERPIRAFLQNGLLDHNSRTGRLGTFYTSSPRYSESHGVRIGMKTAEAEHLLSERVVVGCEANIYLGKAPLTIAFTGGAPRRTSASSALHLIGGHVYAFALQGRDSVGIFDCL